MERCVLQVFHLFGARRRLYFCVIVFSLVLCLGSFATAAEMVAPPVALDSAAPIGGVLTTAPAQPFMPDQQDIDIDIEDIEQDINQIFDEMLDTTNTSGNPAAKLLRRLPRFGISFFRRPVSTYAPIENVPVTAGYVLGPDDELIITLWGMVEDQFRVKVNRDGMANVPHIGSIRLVGYTLEEAKRALKASFDRYFANYSMSVTMGELRSITVYVTGDVRRPGAYTVSSFSTLVNALLSSGGPSASGSLRRIELKRGNKIVTTFDMYDLLLKGDKTKDVRLQPEDVIFVPPVGPLVGLAGTLRRPGVYELKGNTKLEELLSLAGGLSAQTFKGRVQYFQIQQNHYRSIFEGSLAECSAKRLADGDVVRLFPVINTITTVSVSGPVARPGVYGITPGKTRISELISFSGGILATASNRAELTRLTPTQNGPVTTRIQIDLAAAMHGDPANDLPLQLNDYLLVQVIPDWDTQRMVKVTGEVMHPGTYAVIKGERISDLVRRCGGFTSRAGIRGARFTRKSVAEEQRKELNRTADQLERDLLEAAKDSSAEAVNATVTQEEHARRKELINRLRDVDVLGRIVLKVDVPDVIAGTQWDLELEDGDSLHIPDIPDTVEIMGAVYSASSQVYTPRMGINDYVNASGGYLRSAHKRMLYLLKSDGSVIRLTRDTSMLSSKKWTAPKGFSATVEPGDTIVAPVKYSSRQSIEAFKDAIDIIYKIAVSVGVLINNN